MGRKKNGGWFVLLRNVAVLGLIGFLLFQGWRVYHRYVYEKEILKQMVERLQADTRIAEVLVTAVEFNPMTQRHSTTIKFLEYDAAGEPLKPKYFTFNGNIIQFQSLVVRFDDAHITGGHALKGKSVYLFWKAFVLDGENTQEYEIARVNTIPEGYKIAGGKNPFEEEIWRRFWDYALNSSAAVKKGVKNAQIEAPGTKFVPGKLYTLRIEHDGGIRIDVKDIPAVLRGEKL